MGKEIFEMSIPIGAPIYEIGGAWGAEKYTVVGYRIGQTFGDGPDGYQEPQKENEWRIEYGRPGVICSAEVSEIGISLFPEQPN